MWIKLGSAAVGPLTAFAATQIGKKTPWALFGKGSGDTLTDGYSSVIPTFDHALPEPGKGAVVSTASNVRSNAAGVTSKTTVTTDFPNKPGYKSVVQTTASAPRLSARSIWYHISSVRIAGKNKMYVNGNLASETFGETALQGDTILTIGGMQGEDRNNGFIGEVDELAFFGRALSSKEVKRVYDIGKKGDPLFRGHCDLKKAAPKNGGLGECGQLSKKQLKSGHSCKPSCKQGYKIDNSLTCYDGVLSESKCMGLPCETAQTNTKGLKGLGDCPKTMQSGSVCTVACKDGYSLKVDQTGQAFYLAREMGLTVKKGQRACVAGNLQKVSCEFTGCPKVSTPVNGGRGDCPLSDMQNGSECTPTCKAGYMLKQKFNEAGKLSAKASCKDKVFTPAQCEERPCFGMQDPPNGSVGQCPKAGKGQKPVKHSCKYYCNDGYEAVGEAVCGEGQYNNVQCKPKECKFVAPHPYGDKGNCPKSLKSGTKCTPSCDDGYSILHPKPLSGKPYKYLGLTSCHAGQLTGSKCGPNSCKIDMTIANGNMGDCKSEMKHGEKCVPVCNEWFKPSWKSLTCSKGRYVPIRCKHYGWAIHGTCTKGKDNGRLGLKMTCSPADDVSYKFTLSAENMEGTIFKSVMPNGGTSLLGKCQRYTCMSKNSVKVMSYKTKDCTGSATEEIKSAPFSHPPGADGMRLSGRCDLFKGPGGQAVKVKVEWHDASDATTGTCALTRELNDMLGFEDYIAGECQTVFNPNTAEVEYIKYQCRGKGVDGEVGYQTYKDNECRVVDGKSTLKAKKTKKVRASEAQKKLLGGGVALKPDALLVPLNDERKA